MKYRYNLYVRGNRKSIAASNSLSWVVARANECQAECYIVDKAKVEVIWEKGETE